MLSGCDLLGVGRHNVVVRVDAAHLSFDADAVSCDVAPTNNSGEGADSDDGGTALRLCVSEPLICETCHEALRRYTGHYIPVLVKEECVRRLSELMPQKFRESCGVGGTFRAVAMANLQWIPPRCAGSSGGVMDVYSVEVKPKSAWRRPFVVGIVIDGVSHLLHWSKWYVCRFGQMQCWKQQQHEEEHAGFRPPTYCPNDLLMPTHIPTATSLMSLATNPTSAKHVKVRFHGASQPTVREEETSSIPFVTPKDAVFSEVFRHTARALDAVADLRDRLASLQLFGRLSHEEDEPVLMDVELLYWWSRAPTGAKVEWIVDPTRDNTTSCACRHSPEVLQHAKASWDQWAGDPCRWARMPPSVDLHSCVERFFVATTARDVSLIISMLPPPQTPDEVACVECVAPTQRAARTALFGDAGTLVEWPSPALRDGAVCRVGVVDLDDKHHKGIAHYHEQDQGILRAWEQATGFVA